MGKTRKLDGDVIVESLNQGGIQRQVKKISVSIPDGTEQDSSWNLPATAIVHDVFVNVTTAESTGTTKTLDVGLLSSESGGDADGFLDGVNVSATGIKRGVATVTAGGTESYFSSTTRGALFRSFLAGANTATDVGTNYEKPHLSSAVTAKSISYTAGSTDFAELVADIYIVYDVVD